MARSEVRVLFFMVHGALAIAAGATLFYLRELVINPFFAAIAVVIAFLLCGAALMMAGIADWFAAAETRPSNPRQILLYAVAGLALLAAGAFLGFSSSGTLFLLLLLASVHALVFGTLTLNSAYRLRVLDAEALLMYLFGALSILLACAMAWSMRQPDDRTALALVGLYLLLVGAKLIFFAQETRYHALHGFNVK